MIIAQLLESDGPGGAEVVLLRLAVELRRRGHEVFHVGPANGVGWLGDRLRALDFETETFALRRAVDPSAPGRLAALLARRGVQALHSHEFSYAVYGAAAARRLGVPQVCTMHGSQTMTKVWRRRAALRWAFRRSRAVAVVSHATRHALSIDLGIPESAMEVVWNGVPEVAGCAERVREELGIRPGEVVVLAVGNLDTRKGHRLLLRALCEATARGLTRAWRLVIAGGRGGPEREPLLSEAALWGVADQVRVLGQRDDVPDLLAAADLFAMPSLWEGLPLALLEAMLSGTACIASEVSGIPEAIRDGQEGLLVPPGDVDGLAAALTTVIGDDALRERMARAARERALAEFTVGVMADRYERLLGCR